MRLASDVVTLPQRGAVKALNIRHSIQASTVLRGEATNQATNTCILHIRVLHTQTYPYSDSWILSAQSLARGFDEFNAACNRLNHCCQPIEMVSIMTTKKQQSGERNLLASANLHMMIDRYANTCNAIKGDNTDNRPVIGKASRNEESSAHNLDSVSERLHKQFCCSGFLSKWKDDGRRQRGDEK